MSLRRQELFSLARLGVPVMAAQLLQMSMGLMDTIMAGRLSAQDLAGVALAGSVFWPTQLLFSGIITAATPMIAQLSGAKRLAEVGEVIRQGFWIVLFASIALWFVLNHMALLYSLLRIDPETSAISTRYLGYVSFGVPALLSYFLLRYLCEGMGFTMPAMIIALIALALKIPLNYAFIYGQFGAPQLGGAGCGQVSAMLWWIEMSAMLLFVTRKRFRITGTFNRFSWPQSATLMRFVRIGLPSATTTFAEAMAFSAMPLLLGQFGPRVVAAHSIAGNINGCTFMIPLGIGVAATIRVGHSVGAGDINRARAAAQAAVITAALFGVVVGIVLAIARTLIATAFVTDDAVIALAASVILFVACYQIADDTQVVMIGALRGYKDTQAPMLIALLGYWIVGMPISVWLCFGFGLAKPWGIYGMWTGMTAGLAVVAALLALRLWRVSQDESRVLALAAR